MPCARVSCRVGLPSRYCTFLPTCHWIHWHEQLRRKSPQCTGTPPAAHGTHLLRVATNGSSCRLQIDCSTRHTQSLSCRRIPPQKPPKTDKKQRVAHSMHAARPPSPHVPQCRGRPPVPAAAAPHRSQPPVAATATHRQPRPPAAPDGPPPPPPASLCHTICRLPPLGAAAHRSRSCQLLPLLTPAASPPSQPLPPPRVSPRRRPQPSAAAASRQPPPTPPASCRRPWRSHTTAIFPPPPPTAAPPIRHTALPGR